MKKSKKSAAISASLILAAAVFAAGAGSHDPPSGINSGLPDKSLAWRNLDESSEEQHLFMIGFFEGGVHTFTTIFTFKYGPFQKWGFYTLLQEDGSEGTVFVKGECPENSTKVSYTDYGIACGDTTYSGKWPDFTLRIRDPQLNGDIRFHALAKPFTPGKFNLTPDGKTYMLCNVYAPRAATEATLAYREKKVSVKGEGYSDYSFQNFPFTRQGAFYYAVRAFPNFDTPPQNKIYLNFSFQEVHKDYGGGFDAFAFAVNADRILGVTHNVTIEPLKQVTDPDTGYKYITRVSIKAEDTEISFTGSFVVDKVIEVMDIFQWVPPYARKIAAKFFKRPVYFRFLGTLEGQLKTKDGTFPIKQRATSELNYTQ